MSQSDSQAPSQKKSLGILLCGHAPEELIDEHGNYDAMFQRLLGENAFEYQCWAVVDNQLPPDIHAADAWLITGSKHGVYENHPWIAPLEQFIQKAYAADIPIVGICFGHQILAQALGGKVVKFDGGWSVGRVNYELENSTDSEDRKSSAIMAYHQDQVVESPPDARVIGSIARRAESHCQIHPGAASGQRTCSQNAQRVPATFRE